MRARGVAHRIADVDCAETGEDRSGPALKELGKQDRVIQPTARHVIAGKHADAVLQIALGCFLHRTAAPRDEHARSFRESLKMARKAASVCLGRIPRSPSLLLLDVRDGRR